MWLFLQATITRDFDINFKTFISYCGITKSIPHDNVQRILLVISERDQIERELRQTRNILRRLKSKLEAICIKGIQYSDSVSIQNRPHDAKFIEMINHVDYLQVMIKYGDNLLMNIDDSLSYLNPEERIILDAKLEDGISRNTYYRCRKRIIRKIAPLLPLID